MAFSTALYYPRINLTNEAWLKNAILYWDTIQTIVPVSIKKPYTNRTTLELYEAGVVKPFFVESNMSEIENLTEDVIKFLHTPETTQLMLLDQKGKSRIHTDKISHELQELSYIHPEKLPRQVRFIFEETRKGEWYKTPEVFANFYMTLLATRIAQRIGAGLLTDISESDKLATTIKLDSQIPVSMYNRKNMPSRLAEGLLVDLLIQKIAIKPSTSISKIIKFKTDNAPILGKLRTKIGNLAQAISTDMPAEALSQTINDLYKNEIVPTMSDLQQSLSDSGIKNFVESYLKVAFLQASATSLMVTMGLSVPYALLAGTGISLTASRILYNLENEKIIRDNPFSYVMKAQKEL